MTILTTDLTVGSRTIGAALKPTGEVAENNCPTVDVQIMDSDWKTGVLDTTPSVAVVHFDPPIQVSHNAGDLTFATAQSIEIPTSIADKICEASGVPTLSERIQSSHDTSLFAEVSARSSVDPEFAKQIIRSVDGLGGSLESDVIDAIDSDN